MSKHHSMEEYCHCSHEVQYGRDWSDYDPERQYITCPLFQDEELGCTYFRGLIQRSPNGKKISLLSSIKRMESLEKRYIT